MSKDAFEIKIENTMFLLKKYNELQRENKELKNIIQETAEKIQSYKDKYNGGNKEVLNYGLLCDLSIAGWAAVDKSKNI